ncbi:MAG: hypothetical protein HYR96_09575 [Deltaproteobacteria bacterium]|nr:hypothetical protein [Deltaproteobacteria bacterium]
MGTLICCFLPAVFVTLGLGASFAGLVGNFPQLIWLSEHKTAVFGGAAFLIGLAAYLNWRSRLAVCPTDPALAAACKNGRNWSKWALMAAALIFVCGATFAFLLPWLEIMMS